MFLRNDKSESQPETPSFPIGNQLELSLRHAIRNKNPCSETSHTDAFDLLKKRFAYSVCSFKLINTKLQFQMHLSFDTHL